MCFFIFSVKSLTYLLIIYCCVTNFSQMQWFTTIYLYHLMVSVGQKSRCSLAGSSGSGSHTELQLRCQWVQQSPWKVIWRFLTKLEIELPFDPAVPLLGIYLKRSKTLIEKMYASLCSLQHYLRQPRYGSNLSVYHQAVGERCGTYVQ